MTVVEPQNADALPPRPTLVSRVKIPVFLQVIAIPAFLLAIYSAFLGFKWISDENALSMSGLGDTPAYSPERMAPLMYIAALILIAAVVFWVLGIPYFALSSLFAASLLLWYSLLSIQEDQSFIPLIAAVLAIIGVVSSFLLWRKAHIAWNEKYEELADSL